MSIMYSIRKAVSIIGGCLFLIFAFTSYVNGDQVYDAAILLWEQAQFVMLSIGLTFFGLALFVWGMGWTLSDKEKAKMKKHRKQEAERKKKQTELEKKRRLLLKKHGLEEKKKK